MRRRDVGVCLLILELAVAAEVSLHLTPLAQGQTSEVALPYTLTDGGGFLWDVQGDGSIGDGTSDAFDGGLYLRVDGYNFPGFSSAGLGCGGRELSIGPANLAGLEVWRQIYVPSDDTYARFSEVLRNPSGSAVTVRVEIRTNLGSDSNTLIVETSDGDRSFTLSDRWIVTDDSSDGSGDPAVAHVFTRSPTNVSLSGDDLSHSFTVTVPAYGILRVTHYAVQRWERSQAIGVARRLAAGTPEVSLVEGFESGDFARLPWNTGGGAPWYVTSSDRYEGNYAARAGRIGDNQASWLEVTLDVTGTEISFWYRVSSEEGCDYLSFYIDDVWQDGWSGETGGHDSYVSVYLGPGTYFVEVRPYSGAGVYELWVEARGGH